MGKASLISKGSMISKGSFKSKSFVSKSFGEVSGFSPEAQVYIDKIGDMSEIAKPFYAGFIDSCVSVGAFTSDFGGFLAVATTTQENTTLDLKSLTPRSEYRNGLTPYNPPSTIALNSGMTHLGLQFNNNNLVTDYIASAIASDDSHCHLFVVGNQLSARSTFIVGAYDGTNSSLMAPQFTGNKYWSDSMNITVGAGRHEYLGATGTAGLYAINRTANNSVDQWINHTLVNSDTTTGGTQVSLPDFVNTWNQSGTPNSTKWNNAFILAHIRLPKGLPPVDFTTVRTALIDWQLGLQFIDTTVYDKQIIMDGNSHTAIYNRCIWVGLIGGHLANNWDFYNFGVVGQTTPQMDADAPTQIDVLFDGSYSKNILMAMEASNDMKVNGYANVKSNYQTYVANRQAAGFTVVAYHIGSRTAAGASGSPTQQQFDLNIDDFNVWLDGGGSGADRVVTAPIEIFDYRSNYASDAAYEIAMAALRADPDNYHSDEVHWKEIVYQSFAVKSNVAVDSI